MLISRVMKQRSTTPVSRGFAAKSVLVAAAILMAIAAPLSMMPRAKADKYDDKRMLPVLLLVYFFNLVMLIMPVVAIFNNVQYSMFNVQCSMMGVWLGLLILKTVIELFFLYPVAAFFKQVKLLWWFPFMQPSHIIYMVIAGWLGKFGSYQWKGRKVK